MKKLICFFLQLLIIGTSGYAQHPDWINYTNGKSINCIYNDGNYLWLGTTGGLARFDKTTGTSIFYTKHNSGLPDLFVTSVVKENNGNIWVGTYYGGLAMFDGNTWIAFNQFNSPLSSNSVTALRFDQSGALWIGEFGGTLDKFFNGNWTNYTTTASVGSGIEAIEIDTAGILYIGSNNSGLVKYDGTTWTHYTPSNSGLLNARIHDIKIDSHNNLWACSETCGGPGGLTKFDGTTFTFYPVCSNIEKISIDTSDNIWFIDYTNPGLSKFDGVNVMQYNSGNSQVVNPGLTLLEDSGSIWYSSFDHDGLKKFDGNFAVTTYVPSAYNITNNFITGMAADTAGNLWLSHLNGLDKFDHVTFSNFDTLNSGLPTNDLRCVAVDPANNNVWIGTLNYGVVRYDGTNWIVFDKTTYNLPGYGTLKPAVFDALGNTYVLFFYYYGITGIKAGGGIAKYDGTTWTKINLNGIPDTLISCIGIDHQNNLWAGGNGVIEKVSGLTHTIYNSSNSPLTPDDHIQDFLYDKFDNIYAISLFDKIYKINAAMQFSDFSVTNCIIATWVTDWIWPGCLDLNNKIWLGISTICSSTSDYLIAKHDGVSASFYGINNSGLGGIPPSNIINYGNKIYFAGGQCSGITEFTDSTLNLGINDGYPVDEYSVSVYPNPVKQILFISGLDETATLFVYDVLGNQVLSARLLNPTHEINVESLSNGIYLIQIKYNDGRQVMKKVVKE